MTARGFAKAVGEYLKSNRARDAIAKILGSEIAFQLDELAEIPANLRIRSRIAQNWLKRMGFSYNRVTKGVYIDGHERADVVEYRDQIFLPQWAELSKRMVIFSEDGSWKHPPNLSENEKPLVLVTHDESTFNSNDGKRRIWMENGKQPLRPKGRGKGIMASEFLTPGGRLKVPDSVPDEKLLQRIDWPLDGNGKPARYATELLEFGKDNYWTGDKMVDQAVKIATRVFSYAYPGCQALFAFDNSSNHSCYAEDAFLVRNMNLGPGGNNQSRAMGLITRRKKFSRWYFLTTILIRHSGVNQK